MFLLVELMLLIDRSEPRRLFNGTSITRLWTSHNVVLGFMRVSPNLKTFIMSSLSEIKT